MTIGAITRDGDTAEFLDAARRGQLLLRRCRVSGDWAGPQEHRCPVCGSDDLSSEPASGMARIVSFSVIHGSAGPDGIRPVTVVAIAELDEGPWWWSQVCGADPSDLAIGARLRVDFDGAEGYEVVPVFRLA